jgi:hypothetical protein
MPGLVERPVTLQRPPRGAYQAPQPWTAQRVHALFEVDRERVAQLVRTPVLRAGQSQPGTEAA